MQRMENPPPQRKRTMRNLTAQRCSITDNEWKNVFIDIVDEQIPEIIAMKEFKQGELILDYGCKTGYNSKRYFVPYGEKYGWKIHAVDQSKPIIDFAKMHNPSPYVKYLHGDVLDEDFEWANIKFDRIFSILYLQFATTSFLEEIKGMYSLLAPGGLAFISVGYKDIFHSMYKKLVDHPDFGEKAKECVATMDLMYDCIQHPEEWRKKFEGFGIQVKELNVYKKDIDFESTYTLTGFALGFSPFADGLPTAKVKELEAFIQAHLTENKPDKTVEKHPVIYDRIDILLTK